VCVVTGRPDDGDPPVVECPGLVRVLTGCDGELAGAEPAGAVAACPGLVRVLTGCDAEPAGTEPAEAVAACPGLVRVLTVDTGRACDDPGWEPLARVLPP
jgi:hypothetical protein